MLLSKILNAVSDDGRGYFMQGGMMDGYQQELRESRQDHLDYFGTNQLVSSVNLANKDTLERSKKLTEWIVQQIITLSDKVDKASDASENPKANLQVKETLNLFANWAKIIVFL